MLDIPGAGTTAPLMESQRDQKLEISTSDTLAVDDEWESYGLAGKAGSETGRRESNASSSHGPWVEEAQLVGSGSVALTPSTAAHQLGDQGKLFSLSVH